MKKVILILSTAAIIADGCWNRQPKTVNDNNVINDSLNISIHNNIEDFRTAQDENAALLHIESVSDTTKAASLHTYLYKNDTLRQIVELSAIDETKIHFKLISENILKNQKESIEGIAKINNGDVEIDEDEEGNAYPVNEYIYEGDCWLSFRIDFSQTIMSIKMADCIPNPYCPFSSVGFLKK